MHTRRIDPRAVERGSKELVANVAYQRPTDRNGIFRRGPRPTADRSFLTKVRVCGARPCNSVRPGYGMTRFTVLNPAKTTVTKSSSSSGQPLMQHNSDAMRSRKAFIGSSTRSTEAIGYEIYIPFSVHKSTGELRAPRPFLATIGEHGRSSDERTALIAVTRIL